MIELIERFESFTSSVTKAYKSIQKIKIAEAKIISPKQTSNPSTEYEKPNFKI